MAAIEIPAPTIAAVAPQEFCLRWNNHQHNLLTVFDNLLQNESFVDVTLAVEGLVLKAHKMVLSACSPYFETLFVNNPDRHPIMFLKDVKYSEMKALLDFMYKGEVSVNQENLSSLLRTAESLKIKGLTEVSEQQNAEVVAATTGKIPPGPVHQIQSSPQLAMTPIICEPPPVKKLAMCIPQILATHVTSTPTLYPVLNNMKRKRGRPRTLSPSAEGGVEDDDSPTSNTSDSPKQSPDSEVKVESSSDKSPAENLQSPNISQSETSPVKPETTVLNGPTEMVEELRKSQIVAALDLKAEPSVDTENAKINSNHDDSVESDEPALVVDENVNGKLDSSLEVRYSIFHHISSLSF